MENWRRRARDFNKLQWATDRTYIDALIKAGDFCNDDIVLDVGTGTGIMADALSAFAKKVVGLDKSQDMLSRNMARSRANVELSLGDIRKAKFSDEVFNKVVARHVFHHIVQGTQLAMNQCYRVLKKNGVMILSEGVPPSPEVERDYTKIFKLKEKRITFTEKSLTEMMQAAGFNKVLNQILWLRRMSVRNWLANSGLPEAIQYRIFELHSNAGDYFKKAYRMVDTGEDCLIDMKMVILTGVK